ncbi:hypothetical protein C0389_03950 [bacterium]|nr:hypothetical protein [bacterium]
MIRTEETADNSSFCFQINSYPDFNEKKATILQYLRARSFIVIRQYQIHRPGRQNKILLFNTQIIIVNFIFYAFSFEDEYGSA